jgi:hypothetical protein
VSKKNDSWTGIGGPAFPDRVPCLIDPSPKTSGLHFRSKEFRQWPFLA